MKTRSALLPAVASLTIAVLCAQQDTTFSTDVNVVNVFATARDKQSKIVNNLAKDDFVLTEDGRPQTIRYFSRETDLPLTLGLLVDTSLSMRNVLEEEKDASYRFLNQVLRPEKDKTFVIHFDHDTELLQDLTSSRADLRKALDSVRLADDMGQQRGGRYPNNGGRRMQTAGTTLYDAIFLAADELMKKQHGRKALILLTDGMDQGSKTSLSNAIETAQRSDTLVYSILFTDPRVNAVLTRLGGMARGGRGGGRGQGGPAAPQRSSGKTILERISRETGGGFFEVSKKEPIADIYKRIEEELRNQYSIGYVSDQGAAATGFRRITLTTKKSSLTVQAPEGYFPGGK